MVYDQTKLSGGTVRLANRPEGGGHVTLRMPLRRADLAMTPGMVLLVEDTDEIRETVREMLRGLDHSVIEATTANEALALAEVPGIDRILSDISLPGGMSGVDLAERLAASGHRAQISLMTSLPVEDPLRRRAAARFSVLSKPFDAGQLAAFLAEDRP
jgi:CheY-like chemotaxis protein